MLDTIPASERESWPLRLWRLLSAWDAALDSDPIERLEQRVSALERKMNGVPLQRSDNAPGRKRPS
jgi:hypothetical protein